MIDSMNKLTKNTHNTHLTKTFMGQTYLIPTTNKGNIVIDPTDQWFFTYPFKRLEGINLRKLVGDDFLKKAGIFGDILMADTVYNYFKDKYPDPKEAESQIKDYFMFRFEFEHEDAEERKEILNPYFVEKVERYLYNFEDRPEHWYVWNYPVYGIKKMGLADEVLNLRK